MWYANNMLKVLWEKEKRRIFAPSEGHHNESKT